MFCSLETAWRAIFTCSLLVYVLINWVLSNRVNVAARYVPMWNILCISNIVIQSVFVGYRCLWGLLPFLANVLRYVRYMLSAVRLLSVCLSVCLSVVCLYKFMALSHVLISVRHVTFLADRGDGSAYRAGCVCVCVCVSVFLTVAVIEVFVLSSC